jgi:DNA-binding response OmpR family regulator
MLFSKRERKLRRILIVEDEPLVAFDNEHSLREAGYEVVATVDTVVAAIEAMEEDIDLVLLDVKLSDGGSGRDVAHAAKGKGVPLIFVTGGSPDDAKALAIGLLSKPYSHRDLLAAIDAVDARLAGHAVKRLPKCFKLFDG